MIIAPTPRDVGRVLAKRRRLIAGTTALALLSVTTYQRGATPRCAASTSFVARFSTIPTEVPGSVTGSTMPSPTPVDHEEIMNSYMLELQSRELLQRVVADIGPDRIYPHHLSLNPLALLPLSGPPLPESMKREAAIDAAVKRLETSDLTVTGARDANVFTLAVDNPDRAVALAITSRLSDAFLQLVSTLDHNPRTEFVRSQLAVYRAELTRAEDAINDFKARNHIASMAEERTVFIQERALLEQAMLATDGKEAEAAARYDALRTALDGISPVVTTSQNDRDPVELTARTNLSNLEAKKAELAVAFSGNSDAARQVAQSLSAARQILADAQRTRPLTHSDPNHAFEEIQISTVAAAGDMKAYASSEAIERAQLARLGQRLASLSRVESTFDDLSRNYENADQNYRIYLQGVQQARVEEDLDNAAVTSVAVFDPAYAPVRPSTPGAVLLIGIGIAGLLLGALLALLRESLDEEGSPPRPTPRGSASPSGAVFVP